MMGEMFSGTLMGLMGMMSFIGPLLMLFMGPLFGAMGQMFGLMTPR